MLSAAVIAQMLENIGVKRVFGYPGAAIAPLLRELSYTAVRFTLTRHETAAGLAANGYARIFRDVGVCMVTSGPGALNLLPAIACAYADSIPIVAITGQVKTVDVGTDAFQEADVTGAAEPFVKYSFLVKDPETIPRVIKEAFYLARAGRPGPVLIDIPMDVLEAECDFNDPGDIHLRSYNPTVEGNVFQIKKAAETLTAAKKPLVIAGGGIFSSGAVKEIAAFARGHNIPVCTTMMGIGVLPTTDPQNLGMIGVSGAFGEYTANKALHEADTLLFIGARADDRSIPDPRFFCGREIIHVDIDPAELGKNILPTIPIVCDCRFFLEKLDTLVKDYRADTWAAGVQIQGILQEHSTTVAQIQGNLQEHSTAEAQIQEHSQEHIYEFSPAGAYIKKLTERAGANTVIAADVGNNQITAALWAKIDGGRFITSGGMGTMGYALPAAIGAFCAEQDYTPEDISDVICICGDGGFQMCMAELATVKEQQLPIKIIILNDSSLGMVRDHINKNPSVTPWNAAAFGTDLSVGNPDFSALAGCYDIPSERVKDFSEDSIKRILSAKGAYLIDLII